MKKNKKNKKNDFIKNNKFTTVWALGGFAVAASIQMDWMNAELVAPQILLALGSIGIGKLFVDINKTDPNYEPKIIKGAFIGLAAAATIGLTLKTHYYMKDMAQLVLEAAIAYSAITVTSGVLQKTVKGVKNTIASIGKSNKIMPTIEKAKEKINQIRETNLVEDNEFKPLDISKM